jgi:hypothetical protein
VSLSRGNPAPVGTRTMLKEQSFHSGGFIRMADDILGCAFVLLTASTKRSSHEWPVPGGGTSGGSTGAGDGSQIQRPLSRPISPASASTTVPARKKLVSFQALRSPGIFLQFSVSRSYLLNFLVLCLSETTWRWEQRWSRTSVKAATITIASSINNPATTTATEDVEVAVFHSRGNRGCRGAVRTHQAVLVPSQTRGQPQARSQRCARVQVWELFVGPLFWRPTL